MLSRPQVVPLALLYLFVQGWMLLLALLDQEVGAWMSDLMRVIAWAGAIDGLYWMATSRWGGGPVPPEPGEKGTLSKLLNPLALRAEAVARCDAATWASLLLRLLAICGICQIATRFALVFLILIVVILAIFGLLENRWLALSVVWALLFTFLCNSYFAAMASFTVVFTPLLMLKARDQADAQRGMLALACAGLALFWEYRSVTPPPNLVGFLLQVLSTAFNVPQMLPGILLGSAALSFYAEVEPPPEVSKPD
ncbi:hypothetical protein DYH09_01230 [bacterium CPR1]|nr:hypothetical protein [bacterium CPR1]